MSFATWEYALAGALFALVPLLLHLLFRWRRRTIAWGAMQLVRDALALQRRRSRWRQWLLVAIRSLIVFIFGLVLARPYLQSSAVENQGVGPVNAILLIDNSQSMAYQTLDGSLLDRAKRWAREYIEQLPEGSRIHFVGLCDTAPNQSAGPFFVADQAKRVLDQWDIVDRSANLEKGFRQVAALLEQADGLENQVVVLSDHQRRNGSPNQLAKQLLGDVRPQLVDFGPPQPSNGWIADFRLQDQLADQHSPATFLVRVGHQSTADSDATLSLAVGDPLAVVATKKIRLLAGTGEQTVTLSHQFDATDSETQAVEEMPARVSLTWGPQDHLARDNWRCLIVPVVDRMPVLFVDQYGDRESPGESRYGETYAARQLLAPLLQDEDPSGRQASYRVDQLTQKLLAEANAVVIAGVSDPGQASALLHDYVRQGGQLLIATGATFDARRWTQSAWLAGQGILPLPLEDRAIGVRPSIAPAQVTPFSLDPSSFQGHPLFDFAELDDSQVAQFFAEPLFFKAVVVREDAGQDNDTSTTQVLARFDNGLPYLIERHIGDGRVIFCTSGIFSDWNTIPHTGAMLLVDRIVRDMLGRTLLVRNHTTEKSEIRLPLAAGELAGEFALERPRVTGVTEPLSVTYHDSTKRGLSITQPAQQGIYWVEGFDSAKTESPSDRQPIWSRPIAVNLATTLDDASEFRSDYLGQSQRLANDKTAQVRWIDALADVSDAQAEIGSLHDSSPENWQWLTGLLMLLLIVEMLVGVGSKPFSSTAASTTPLRRVA